jgi:integrase
MAKTSKADKPIRGSISDRGNGFQGTYPLKEKRENGSNKTKSFTGKDLKALVMEMNEFHIQYEKGLVEKEQTKFTLATLLDVWSWDIKKTAIEDSTFKGYKQCIENYLKPYLGDMNIHDLESVHVVAMINKMINQPRVKKGEEHIIGLSARTIELTITVLGAALKYAVESRKIQYNVARTTEVKGLVSKLKNDKAIKEKRSGIKKSMSKEEVTIFMKEVNNLNRYGELLKVQLLLGSRPGEAMGLTWNSIDFINREIKIEYDWAREYHFEKVDDEESKESKVELGNLKRVHNIRTLPASDIVMDILKNVKDKQEVERKRRLERGMRYNNEHGLVFTTRFGTGLEPRNYNRLFDAVMEKTKIEGYSPHSLRHTANDLMKASRIDSEVRQAYVGHRIPGVTVDYMTRILETARPDIEMMDPVYKEILGIS